MATVVSSTRAVRYPRTFSFGGGAAAKFSGGVPACNNSQEARNARTVCHPRFRLWSHIGAILVRSLASPAYFAGSLSLSAFLSSLTIWCAASFASTLSFHRGEARTRSEEHTSELQSRRDLVCRLLLEKKKQ